MGNVSDRVCRRVHTEWISVFLLYLSVCNTISVVAFYERVRISNCCLELPSSTGIAMPLLATWVPDSTQRRADPHPCPLGYCGTRLEITFHVKGYNKHSAVRCCSDDGYRRLASYLKQPKTLDNSEGWSVLCLARLSSAVRTEDLTLQQAIISDNLRRSTQARVVDRATRRTVWPFRYHG